ncbi:MAG: DNA polymerase III subunit delta [Coriobacteriia bacterium]|nr:DNA polymerase III subunit delta [Coriobacteriia bacterium]
MAPTELKPLYLIVSEQAFLRDQALDRLRVRLRDMGTDLDFNYEQFDAETADPTEIVAAASTLPFISELRLVVVTRTEKLDKEALDLLAGYAQAPSPTTILCLVGEKLNRSTRLYKAIAAQGTVLDRKAPARRELPGVVRGLFAERGLDCDVPSPEALINLVGEDLGALSTAVATIAAYLEATPKKKVTRKVIAEVIGASAEVKGWEFTDALAERRCGEALVLVRRALDQGLSLPALGTMALRTVRQLIVARSLLDEGVLNPADQLIEELKLPANLRWRTKSILQQARAFKARKLREALCAYSEVELAIKSSPDNLKSLAFERWIIDFCQ